MKPYLVLLRCGPGSPLLDRLAGFTDAAFDVALSWSGPAAPALAGAVFVHPEEEPASGRWPALGRTISAHAEQIAAYSHLWLPDDDIVFDVETVTRLFLICDQLDLELGQPAFQPGSAASHPVALQHRDFQLRFTNHVDGAAPMLSRSMLAKVLPALADPALNPEDLWPRLSRLGRVAIVDATPVARTGRQPSPVMADGDLVNLGGLLESGDAWCLGPQPVGVDVMLQALMNSCAPLDLRAGVLARYLAHHIALVDSGAARSIQGELERALGPVGMRFNCAVVPRRQGVVEARTGHDAQAARALKACEAELRDLQARYRSVVQERDTQHELLNRVAGQIGDLAKEVRAPTLAARRIEAV